MRTNLLNHEVDDSMFDLSTSGLAESLRIMLNVHRQEERALINKVRQGTAPANYGDQLKTIRDEKAEIKKVLKPLLRNQRDV
jgi:hypothetical protein